MFYAFNLPMIIWNGSFGVVWLFVQPNVLLAWSLVSRNMSECLGAGGPMNYRLILIFLILNFLFVFVGVWGYSEAAEGLFPGHGKHRLGFNQLY